MSNVMPTSAATTHVIANRPTGSHHREKTTFPRIPNTTNTYAVSVAANRAVLQQGANRLRPDLSSHGIVLLSPSSSCHAFFRHVLASSFFRSKSSWRLIPSLPALQLLPQFHAHLWVDHGAKPELTRERGEEDHECPQQPRPPGVL